MKIQTVKTRWDTYWAKKAEKDKAAGYWHANGLLKSGMPVAQVIAKAHTTGSTSFEDGMRLAVDEWELFAAGGKPQSPPEGLLKGTNPTCHPDAPDPSNLADIPLASALCMTGASGMLAFVAHQVRRIDPPVAFAFFVLAVILAGFAAVSVLDPLPLASVRVAG